MSSGESRLALLIGAQTYPHLGSLRTPNNDVRRIRRMLIEKCGFDESDVTLLIADDDERVTSSQLRRALAEFAEKVRLLPPSEHAFAMIYFAGHGVTHRGDSYILSDEIASLAPEEIAEHGLKLDTIIDSATVNPDIPILLFIDACRTLSRARGFELEPIRLPSYQRRGVLVDMASGPGEIALDRVTQTDLHSPYALALTKHLPTIGLSVGDALLEARAEVQRETRQQQFPQTVITLSNRLMFVPNLQTTPSPGPQGQESAVSRERSASVIPRRDYTDAEIRKLGHLIHKLKAKDTSGRWAYYFVLVEKVLEAQFLVAIEGDGIVDLENYGVVIASCFGEKPTQELCDFIFEKYGFVVDRAKTLVKEGSNNSLSISEPRLLTAALRQKISMKEWKWVVLTVSPERQSSFIIFVNDLWNLECKSIFGKVDPNGKRSHIFFDIGKISKYGDVAEFGLGPDIPIDVIEKLKRTYNFTLNEFSWSHENRSYSYISYDEY